MMKKILKNKPISEQKKTEMLRKKCVLLAKQISKARDKHRCVYCGRTKPEVAIHSHHIYNEGCHKGMSADIDNLATVCFTHHSSTWNTHDPSFHKNPQEMADFMNENYPERMKELKLRAQHPIKCSLDYWQKKLEELYKKLSTCN